MSQVRRVRKSYKSLQFYPVSRVFGALARSVLRLTRPALLRNNIAHVQNGGPFPSSHRCAIRRRRLDGAIRIAVKEFARGASYFASGAVVDLVQTRDAIKAHVLGSDEYRVELRPVRGVLAASCTCPVGKEGEFCKHAVAAGLAWLGRGEDGGDDLAGVRIHLKTENKEALVDMLVEQAANDPELRARLQTAALRRRPPSDLKAMKEVVRKAFAARGFVDMRAFIARADGVADLLDQGRA